MELARVAEVSSAARTTLETKDNIQLLTIYTKIKTLIINPFASGIKKGFPGPHNGIIFSKNSEKISSHYKFHCQ